MCFGKQAEAFGEAAQNAVILAFRRSCTQDPEPWGQLTESDFAVESVSS
jgi:hypothetical protein